MDDTKFLATVGILLAVLIFWPFAIAWALNNLFSFSIPYDIKTWLSILILSSLFTVRSSARRVEE